MAETTITTPMTQVDDIVAGIVLRDLQFMLHDWLQQDIPLNEVLCVIAAHLGIVVGGAVSLEHVPSALKQLSDTVAFNANYVIQERLGQGGGHA